jgi:hypothetical protein
MPPVAFVRVFTSGLRYCGFLMLFALSVPAASRAEAPARAPLDALWQEHMLTGSAATIYVDESGQRTVPIPRRSFNEQHGETYAESAATTTSGIQVARLDERWLLWRNGGWVLQGGLLARVRGPSSAIELYGKAVIRRPPYVPGGPFPRDPPMTTGYEFFLLLRKANASLATILRQWTFQPSDVVEAGRVTARLQYGTATRKAVVTIAGLKTPVEEAVEAPH